MSEQKLCWKCKQKIMNTLLSPQLELILLDGHCHHDEPEEKPKEKCWCEYPNNLANSYSVWHVGINLNIKAKHCPDCGRKL